MPQFVVTTTDSLPGTTILPIDTRALGGPVCTIAVGEGESSDSILTSIASALPDLAQTIQVLSAFDAIFLQDAVGQVWDDCPPTSVTSTWLALRCDRARLQQAPPSLTHMLFPGTTSTTTAAVAAHSPEPTLTVVLAGGGLLLRSVPLVLSQVQVASVVTDLVLALAVNGRLPQEPVISVAAAMPRSAAAPTHHMIGFIVTEMADSDREVVVLHDPSLDGSLLSAMAIDRGTFLESMVAPAQARRGFAAALNGAPQEGARRHLITGDLVQIYQKPLAARTWPVAHMYSILPALRLFALPIRLPGARSFLGRLPADAARERARQDLLEVLELRMLEQAIDLGEPGPGGVSSGRHGTHACPHDGVRAGDTTKPRGHDEVSVLLRPFHARHDVCGHGSALWHRADRGQHPSPGPPAHCVVPHSGRDDHLAAVVNWSRCLPAQSGLANAQGHGAGLPTQAHSCHGPARKSCQGQQRVVCPRPCCHVLTADSGPASPRASVL